MSSSQSGLKRILRFLGPGLLFASAAIGTSHLVLSTRAGAHHGMIFFWIITAALLLKYPFFEFGPRYAHATGKSLVEGYRRQGRWAVYMYAFMIVISMFAVPAAVGAVSAGLLSALFHIPQESFLLVFGALLMVTLLILLLGGYTTLDNFIKILSVILLVTITIAFVAVCFKGPTTSSPDFAAPPLLHGAGIVLLVSLVGWMPTGMETSAMHSIWTLEKIKATSYTPSMKEGLLDFKVGYVFTAMVAFMFLTIGAFTVYGSGTLLDGSSTAFSAKLINVFRTNLGLWSQHIVGIAAFGTIYGTLIGAWDAFTRSIVWSLRIMKYGSEERSTGQNAYLQRNYRLFVILIAIGAFLLFYLSQASMIRMLEYATIASFLFAPIISALNLRAILSDDVPAEHRPGKTMIILAWIGLVCMVLFALYYLYAVLTGNAGGH